MSEHPFLSQAFASQFALTVAWQSALALALGLAAGRLLRRHAAKAHLVLLLASVASVASPVLTAAVRQMEWGVLPPRSATVTIVQDLEPTQTTAADASSTKGLELPVLKVMPAVPEPTANESVVRDFASPTATPALAPQAAIMPLRTTSPLIARLSKARLSELLPAVMFGAWLACSLVLVLRLAALLLAGRRLVRRSATESHPELVAALREAAQLLGVRGDLRLSMSAAARCPMIWCWGRQPILLVPPSARDQRGISWCSIFCHELAHWLRRDHLSALCTELLVIAIPWHPLAWLSWRQLSALREQACDDWVLASKQEATDYAESLVNLVPQNSPTFALPALRSYESLKRRLEHVLAGVRVAPRAGRNWIALASLVSLAAAAGIAFAQQRSQTTNAKADAQTPPASTISADQSSDNKLLPAREENGDDFTVRGRVLKPDGQPAAGARLSIVRVFFGYLGRRANSALVTTGTAAADGRFALTYHPSQIVAGVGRQAQWRETTVLAQADGFGLQWADWQDIDPEKPLVLRLAIDTPIRGRVIDLEGRPVEGAVVSISGVEGAVSGTIDPWLNAVKSGADAPTAWRATKLSSLPYCQDGWERPVKTGPDGRFALSGIGPDRIVGLALSGETITHTSIMVVTRTMAPITGQGRVGFSPMKVYGNEFTLQAHPSRDIIGTVRDAATGRPLGGVTVASDVFAGTRLAGIRDVVSQTDGQGRYRLVGMPKGKGNEIMAFPNDDQPYLMRTMVVPDAPGAGPVTVDIELHRGIWIEGRVFDKATGKPAIARLYHWPFRDNPFARALPEFKGLNVDGEQFRYATRPDGSFRLVGLPGRAIVGAEAVAASYKLGVGADKIKGVEKNGYFPTYFNTTVPMLKWPNAIREIDPSKDATTVHCDFALERGNSIRVTLIDRESKPVAGCAVEGRATGYYAPVAQATFDLENLSLHETRPILIEHKERRIGKFLMLKFDEKTPRTMSITLEPSATLVGRLLDADGVPLGATHLEADPLPGGDFWPRLPSVVCRTNGTFRYPGLVAGCDYSLSATGPDIEFETASKRVKIEPGKVIDLGDIKLKRRP
jgi:beta-lactamase regulating signal transducer with metallopeptidase domain